MRWWWLPLFFSLLFIQRMFFSSPVIAKQITPLAPLNIKALLLPAIAAGVVLGATGVGGGVVVLPLLLRYANLSIKQAIGTSILRPPYYQALWVAYARWSYRYSFSIAAVSWLF